MAATRTQLSHVLSDRQPRRRGRPPADRRLRRASSSRASSARPPTSSPRTTCAPARGRSSRRSRARTDELRRAVRVEGVPVHGGLPRARRGGPRLRRRRPAASSRSRCAAASTRRASTCTATRSPSDELRLARERRRRPHRDRQRRRDRAARGGRRRRAAAARAAARHARTSRGEHARQDLHRPGRLEVRLLAGRRAGGDRAPAGRPRASTSPACTCTSARRSSSSTPFRRAVEAIAPLGDFADLQPRRRARRRLHGRHDEPPPIEDYVAAKVDAVERVLGPGKRILDEPGRALVANVGVTLYTVQSVKRNVSTWVARRRRDVRQPAPDALRRASTRRRSPTASAAARPLPPGRQALRVRRRDRARRRARRPARRRRPRHARDRRLRLRDGQQLQRRPAPAGDLLLAAATRASSCGARPTTTSSPAMSTDAAAAYRIGLLGHGTVGAAFADAARAARRPRRGDHRACGRGSAAS